MASVVEKLRLASSIADAKSRKFWAGVFSEYVGMVLFLLIGMGSILFMGHEPSGLHIALGVGLALSTSIRVTGNVSGGHLNPAVSFAMLLMRKISLFRFLMYVIIQCFGAASGVGILRAVTPSALYGTFGTTTINEAKGVTVGQGLGTEMMITFMLVLTVFACCDWDRVDLKGSGPLAIGLSVAIGHLFALHSTGASMNPARSLGSSAISGIWTNHWVYWVGPFLGAGFAGLVYDLLIAADAAPQKVTAWFLADDYPIIAETQKVSTDDTLDDKDDMACMENGGEMKYDTQM